jgi:hypothetical protein
MNSARLFTEMLRVSLNILALFTSTSVNNSVAVYFILTLIAPDYYHEAFLLYFTTLSFPVVNAIIICRQYRRNQR